MMVNDGSEIFVVSFLDYEEYPLVNVQKAIENHNFQWVNPLSMGHFQ